MRDPLISGPRGAASGIRGALCVLLVLGLATACGSSATKRRRDSVNAYLHQVRAAQGRLLARQSEIDKALHGFSLSRSTPAELHRLRQARAILDAAFRRVRSLHPPPEAHRLHALLVRRLALQRSVLGELVATAAYIPRLDAITPLLRSAATGLQHDLAQAKTQAPSPQGKGASTLAAGTSNAILNRYAAAFGRYGSALQRVETRLGSLTAPPILKPALDGELRTLRRSIALCSTIRRALLGQDFKTANRAIRSLLTVVSSSSSTTRKAQAKATRAYDAELHRIQALTIKVDAERNRLVAKIG